MASILIEAAGRDAVNVPCAFAFLLLHLSAPSIVIRTADLFQSLLLLVLTKPPFMMSEKISIAYAAVSLITAGWRNGSSSLTPRTPPTAISIFNVWQDQRGPARLRA